MVIQAEIADTMKKRAEGLMYRDHLANGRGMLFTFDQAQPWTFWMKNTKIPLDIIYFDHDRKLVSVAHAPPCTLGDRCPPFPSDGPALYVLELNTGTVDALGAKPGDVLELDPGIQPPKK